MLPDKWRHEYEEKGWRPDGDSAREFLDERRRRGARGPGGRGDPPREEIETPDSEEAAGRALILQDDKQARHFLRYNGESRNDFLRHFDRLLKTLDSDAARTDEDRDGSPNEAIPADPCRSRIL